MDENTPRLCYRNYVTPDLINASSEAPGFPISNAAFEGTDFVWQAADTTQQTIDVIVNSSTIDYVGIARHNLDEITRTVEIQFDGNTVLPASTVSQEQALILFVEPANPFQVSIIINGGVNPALIGVIYVGESTGLQRKLYVGHTPIIYGRTLNQITGVSQAGEYLGDIVLNRTLSTAVALRNLTPEWYRQNLDPFFAAVPRKPAFWSWRPGTYPRETAYAWIEGNPRPVNQRNNGMMEINFNLRGIS